MYASQYYCAGFVELRIGDCGSIIEEQLDELRDRVVPNIIVQGE
jgi:hypothetical protein